MTSLQYKLIIKPGAKKRRNSDYLIFGLWVYRSSKLPCMSVILSVEMLFLKLIKIVMPNFSNSPKQHPIKTQTCKQEYASTLGQIGRKSKVDASCCTYLSMKPWPLSTLSPVKTNKQTRHMQNLKCCFWDIGGKPAMTQTKKQLDS